MLGKSVQAVEVHTRKNSSWRRLTLYGPSKDASTVNTLKSCQRRPCVVGVAQLQEADLWPQQQNDVGAVHLEQQQIAVHEVLVLFCRGGDLFGAAGCRPRALLWFSLRHPQAAMPCPYRAACMQPLTTQRMV